MHFQKKLFILLTLGLMFSGLLSVNTSHASLSNQSSSIVLKSCKNINIRADHINYQNDSISNYSGNVQFIYGLANVRAEHVTLIRNKDGSCKLIANIWHSKQSN
ncbi:MAG: LptA/OstA family protein [Kangiellaceae bacterium]|nr:LptA/OstA family protein [Kangiellaceae bacterium]